MYRMSRYLVLALYLVLCPMPAGAMTQEKIEEILNLAADGERLRQGLLAQASTAKRTAELITDLEEFASLPSRLKSGILEASQQNCREAASRLKMLLPKQYLAETQNDKILPFPGSSACLDPLCVPQIIHFIWLGSPIPDKYLANIGAISALNPEYQVTIWLDDQSRAGAGAIREPRCKVRHVDQILQHAVASEDARSIYRTAVSKSGFRPNFAAASDILRLLILLSEGGIYLDTDTSV